MVQLTGGQVVQIDTFTNVVFKESLKRMFAKEGEEGFLGMSAHATLEVLPSRDIKVSGRQLALLPEAVLNVLAHTCPSAIRAVSSITGRMFSSAQVLLRSANVSWELSIARTMYCFGCRMLVTCHESIATERASKRLGAIRH